MPRHCVQLLEEPGLLDFIDFVNETFDVQLLRQGPRALCSVIKGTLVVRRGPMIAAKYLLTAAHKGHRPHLTLTEGTPANRLGHNRRLFYRLIGYVYDCVLMNHDSLRIRS